MEKNNNKIINAWCSYDIANSAYNLIITTVLFPIYYQEVTQSAFGGNIISIFGISIRNTVLYDYAIAMAYLSIIFIAPILSGIADYGGVRKRFMQFFTTLGASACIALYWFNGANISFGLLMVILAVVGYAGSLLYYNSFLPIIASPDHQDRISARGFSWGYGGSLLLLMISLVVIEKYQMFGFSGKLEALKFSFIAVGVWWIGVAQFAFWFLKDYPTDHKINLSILTRGHKEVLSVFKKFEHDKTMKLFLLSYFFFSMGVQTVMLVSTLFGSAELHIEGSKLIMTLLIIQILAIVGSTLFAEVSIRKGNKTSLIIMLIIWIGVCISAFYVTTEQHFYMLAALVGLVMGGIQSQARSTYSKLIPADTTDTASYFSLYDITEKIAIVIGMFSFGFIESITGNMRNSTLLLSVYFIISLIILAFTRLKK